MTNECAGTCSYNRCIPLHPTRLFPNFDHTDATLRSTYFTFLFLRPPCVPWPWGIGVISSRLFAEAPGGNAPQDEIDTADGPDGDEGRKGKKRTKSAQIAPFSSSSDDERRREGRFHSREKKYRRWLTNGRARGNGKLDMEK